MGQPMKVKLSENQINLLISSITYVLMSEENLPADDEKVLEALSEKLVKIYKEM